MTVHFWGEDPTGLWTLSVTDNDSNNRQHYYKKAQQADFEDATRVIMDETETFTNKEKADERHILKTMEDTEGELFHGTGKLYKVDPHKHKKKYVRHHKKHKSWKHHGFASHLSNNKSMYGKGSATKGNRREDTEKLQNSKTAKKLSKLDQGNKIPFNRTEDVKLTMKWNGKDQKIRAIPLNLQPSRQVSNVGVLNQTAAKANRNNSEMEYTFYGRMDGNSKPPGSKDDTEEPAKQADSLSSPNTGLKGFVSMNSHFNFSVSSLMEEENAIPKASTDIQSSPLVSRLAVEATTNPLVAKLFGIVFTRRELATKPMQSDQAYGSVRQGGGSSVEQSSTPREHDGITETIEEASMLDKDKNIGDQTDISTLKIAENLGSGDYVEYGSGTGDARDLSKPRSRACDEEKEDSNCTSGNSAVEQNPKNNLSINSVDSDQTMNPAIGHEGGTEVSSDGIDNNAAFAAGKRDNGSNLSGNDTLHVIDTSLTPGRTLDIVGDLKPKDPCSFLRGVSDDALRTRLMCLESENKRSAYDRNKGELANYLATEKVKVNLEALQDEETFKDRASQHKSSSSKNDNNKDDTVLLSHSDPEPKSKNKDLSMLEQALTEQLSRLPDNPDHPNSNYEILSRVREDINHGDVEDLELLEDQLSDKIQDRIARDEMEDLLDDDDENFDKDDPGVNNAVASDEDDVGDDKEHDDDDDDDDDDDEDDDVGYDNNRLEPRRISPKAGTRKWKQRYRVKSDKYGKGNSGLLETWTLILYGTK